MSTRKLVVIGLAVIALVGGIAFYWPQASVHDTVAPPAPEFSSRVLVENGRLMLPPEAGNPATVRFDVTNVGEQDALFVREVAVEHARASIVETAGPEPRRLEIIPIHPGETVTFGSQENQVVLANYDSNVVPGVTLDMTLTFSNGQTVSVPLTVDYPEDQVDTATASGASIPEA